MNRRWNPLKREEPAPTWWMWAGTQYATARWHTTVASSMALLPSSRRPWGTLRCTQGEAAGEKSGTTPVNRSVVNVGTAPGLPSPPASQAGGGQVRCRLLAPERGGALVVVRGRESRPHGEGGQRVRSFETGMPGGRR